jgi:hypothetical protein
VIPLAVIPRLPGVAPLLRVAWIERRDFELTKNAQAPESGFSLIRFEALLLALHIDLI